MDEEERKSLLSRILSAPKAAWDKARGNIVSDIALGLTPAGVVADTEDMYKAAREGNKLGVALAGLGFIPVVGDIPKLARKVSPADLAKILPKRVTRAPTAGSVGVGDILSGRVGSGAEEAIGQNIANYAGDVYSRALEKGIPMEAANVAARRRQQFPLTGFHGTRSIYDSANLASRDLRPDMPRSFFAAIGKTPEEIADAERLAATYAIQESSNVFPLAINPGEVLDVDAANRMWSDIEMESVVQPMMEAGMREADIVDILAEAQPEVMSGLPEDLQDEFISHLRRVVDPGYIREIDPYVGPDILTTDDVAQIAKVAGYDSAIIRNVLDSMSPEITSAPGDIIAIPNPVGRVRHRSAVFDPKSARLGNIFSGTAGAMLGGSALNRALNEPKESSR